jgi:hypothetical protein
MLTKSSEWTRLNKNNLETNNKKHTHTTPYITKCIFTNYQTCNNSWAKSTHVFMYIHSQQNNPIKSVELNSQVTNSSILCISELKYELISQFTQTKTTK